MQQGAQDPAHMGIVVNDQEAQAIEIDADHGVQPRAPPPENTR
jgi:hypothetical protein